jgi:hypothetical protein
LFKNSPLALSYLRHSATTKIVIRVNAPFNRQIRFNAARICWSRRDLSVDRSGESCDATIGTSGKITFSFAVRILPFCPGGVAQRTSHPPKEREDPGSNPARV